MRPSHNAKIFTLYLGGYAMETLAIVVFALIMMKLAEDMGIGLDNSRNLNHADEYWIAPAVAIAIIGAIMVLL